MRKKPNYSAWTEQEIDARSVAAPARLLLAADYWRTYSPAAINRYDPDSGVPIQLDDPGSLLDAQIPTTLDP